MDVCANPPTRHQQAKPIIIVGCRLVRSWKEATDNDMRADWAFIAMLRKAATYHDTFVPENASAEDTNLL